MIPAEHRLKSVPQKGFSSGTGFSLWWTLLELALTLVLIVPSQAADLAQTLDALVDSSPVAAHSNFGIHVVDLKAGKPVYGRYEDRLLLPASNMKLFTTALALQKLGAGYRFQTRLLEEASGDVTLVGSGDPSMSGRIYPYGRTASNGPPLRAIEDLADQAVAKGLTHVRGDIIGDDALYPWEPFPPSWTQSDALGESGAPISALSVADNFITATITPGAKPGDLATLSLAPALEYFAIDNRIQTEARGSAAQIRVTRAPGSRQLLIDGTMPASAAKVYANIAIDDPALYAACALYDALTRRGVSITGHPVARHRSAADAYKAPEGTVLATRSSPSVGELVRMTDKVSENLHAELLLREVGRVDRKAGTREAGLASLNALLAQIGGTSGDPRADFRADFRIDDGSGLSRNTLVTPRLITRLLEFMYHAPGPSSGGANSANSAARDSWIAMLPIGGEDGTLARRLGRPAEARAIHAKTGTLNRAIALSGYADNKNGGWLAFSILVNDFAAPQSEVEAWVDKIALALVE
jgi:D-alanyl-D-alanine carboxypeptidase/D-alanyl-D-alanine-endopeptidase (penicillin-binding protein 4)